MIFQSIPEAVIVVTQLLLWHTPHTPNSSPSILVCICCNTALLDLSFSIFIFQILVFYFSATLVQDISILARSQKSDTCCSQASIHLHLGIAFEVQWHHTFNKTFLEYCIASLVRFYNVTHSSCSVFGLVKSPT